MNFREHALRIARETAGEDFFGRVDRLEIALELAFEKGREKTSGRLEVYDPNNIADPKLTI